MTAWPTSSTLHCRRTTMTPSVHAANSRWRASLTNRSVTADCVENECDCENTSEIVVGDSSCGDSSRGGVAEVGSVGTTPAWSQLRSID
jgi:hypothetical protein